MIPDTASLVGCGGGPCRSSLDCCHCSEMRSEVTGGQGRWGGVGGDLGRRTVGLVLLMLN